MILEPLAFPQALARDYPLLADEPRFDPSVHLDLRVPDKVLSLGDLGYRPDACKKFPSQVAVSEPFSFLSAAGVEALRDTARKFRAASKSTEGDPRAAYIKPRGGSYCSTFARDLCRSPEIAEFLSELAGTPVGVHSMPTQQAGFIYAPADVTKTNQGWHLDTIGFACVIPLHDPATLQGGGFQYFHGTRDEVAAHIDCKVDELRSSVGRLSELPTNRVKTLYLPGPGHAVFMQGNLVLHRGEPIRAPADRIMFVPGFMSLDTDYPDVMHWQEVQRWNSPALEAEYARHLEWWSNTQGEQPR